MRSFISSQFSCYPLIWMFNSRNIDDRINALYERALRLVYDGSKTYLSENYY